MGLVCYNDSQVIGRKIIVKCEVLREFKFVYLPFEMLNVYPDKGKPGSREALLLTLAWWDGCVTVVVSEAGYSVVAALVS